MPRNEVVKNLAEIAESFFRETSEPPEFGMTIHVPAHIAEENGLDTQTVLLLGHKETGAYQKALAALLSDIEFEHLDERQIKEELRNILWHLYIRRFELRARKKRLNVVRNEIANFAKQQETYRFMFGISGFVTIESPITIGGVTFEVLTEEIANKWITIGSIVTISDLPAEVGSVIALAEADGASVGRTSERASVVVDNALDELRTAISAFRDRIWDKELRFARGDSYVCTTLPKEDSFYSGWQNISDVPLNLGGQLYHSTTEQLALLGYLHSDFVSKKIRDQLVRAIDWIGQSIVRADPDDKVVDLCTALECLLTTKDDRRKGEAIAIRTMILGELLEEGFTHPANTLYLYELRSRIVHGSARNICSDSDYTSLRHLVYEVLIQIIQLLKQDNSITKPPQLVRAVTEPFTLEKCIRWLDRQDDDGSKALLRYAKCLRSQ